MTREHITYYLIGVLLLFSTIMQSQTLVVEEGQENYTVDTYLALAIDKTNALSFSSKNTIDSILNFKPLSDWQKEAFEPEQTYWGKFQLQNSLLEASTRTEWVLKFSISLTSLDVYAVDNLGNIQTAKSGFFTALPDRTFMPIVKGNIVKLIFLPDRFYTIYYKTISNRQSLAPEFELSLIPVDKYLIALNKEKERDYIYFGFVLMILIYNLILYFFAKDKAFISYSAYLLGILVFTAYNSGNLANWITPSLSPNQPELIHFFKLSFYIAIIGYLAFVRTFLDLPKLLPTWDTIFKWFSILTIPAMLLDGYLMASTSFSYNISDRVSLSFATIFVICIFSIIFPLIKTKDRKAYFIIIGNVAVGIGTLLVIWSRLHDIDFSTLSLKIGSAIEIIAFSLGLAYRRLLMEKERQQTHFQLIKSKLIQEQEHKEAGRLKELDTLKSRLYTNITHEFRTPLTVIMGMNNQIDGNEKEKKLINRNSRNLLQLINQMLELAKAEEGKLKLDLVQKDIIGYLQYLVESFLSAAESKDIKLTFYTETPKLLMNYDENKILHIVQNLLSNAIKFTPQYGKIIVHTKLIEINQVAFLQMKVKDTGIGISSKDIPYVFDRFYQSDNTSTRKEGGTGIGLALTKELVQLMKGTITFNSELGNGSEFIIKLLYETTALAVTDDSVAPEEILVKPMPLINTYSLLEKDELSTLGIISNTTDRRTDIEKKEQPLLLIIEDNEDVLTYIEKCLEDQYIIQTARNGQEGIEKALAIIPDIIISDVMMPKKDGFEVTQSLKQNTKTSHIPIILLTAKATQENKLKGLKYGADAYLMKPFDKAELTIRLEKLVELRIRLQVYYSKNDFLEKKEPSSVIDSEAAFLQQLRETINKHLTIADFSVPQIAQIMQMSQVQVYRKLKALTGKTPTQYVRILRMKRAMELLNTTTLNISEIAYDLGFSDPNYFSRTFQQIYGKTPSSIRKAQKN